MAHARHDIMGLAPNDDGIDSFQEFRISKVLPFGLYGIEEGQIVIRTGNETVLRHGDVQRGPTRHGGQE